MKQLFTLACATALSLLVHSEVTLAGESETTLTRDFNEIILPDDFGTYQIDLDNYFSNPESELEYTASFISDVLKGYEVSVDGSILTLQRTSSLTTYGDPKIEVTATDENDVPYYEFIEVEIERAEWMDLSLKESLDGIELWDGFSKMNIDLNNYFESDYGDITYEVVVAENEVLDISLSGSRLTIEEGSSEGSVLVEIKAKLESEYTHMNYSVVFHYPVGEAPNRKPHLIKMLDDVYLIEGFGTDESVDLNDLFADADGDELSFSTDGHSWIGSKSVIPKVYGGKVHVEENALGVTTVDVIASDGEKELRTQINYHVIKAGNEAISIDPTFVNIELAMNSGTTPVLLSDYFVDTDPVTYKMHLASKGSKISGDTLMVNTSKSQIETVWLSGNDGKGSIVEQLFTILTNTGDVPKPQIAAEMPDIEIDLHDSVSINLSDYFTSESGTIKYLAMSSSGNTADADASGSSLKIVPHGIGIVQVKVGAYLGNTFAEQTFVVRCGGYNGANPFEKDNNNANGISLSEHTSVTDIQVYPTLFTETLTVENAEGLPVTVCNISGAELFKTAIKGNSEVINLGQLAPGMYFLHVTDKTFQIIKK